MKYELNNVYNVNSYEAIKDIPDKTVDLIVTDPPYEFGTGGIRTGLFKTRDITNSSYNHIRNNDLDKGVDLAILDDFVRIMKRINIYIWCNKEQIYDYLTYFVKERECNFEVLIWAKSNIPPFTGGHYLKDKEYCLFFWEQGAKVEGVYDTLKTVYMGQVNLKDKNDFGHPTIKDYDITKNIILNSSKEGDVIFDAFLGSGTTCVAAKELGRQYLGFEINPDYYKIACDRLNGLTQLDRKMKETGFIDIFDIMKEEGEERK